MQAPQPQPMAPGYPAPGQPPSGYPPAPGQAQPGYPPAPGQADAVQSGQTVAPGQVTGPGGPGGWPQG